MVIIDEAHKFRNDTAQAYDELQRICKTKNNEDEVKKVMLISATPLNNPLSLFYNAHCPSNQCAFFSPSMAQ
jgi:SNF2 family DNA or RNA helicase